MAGLSYCRRNRRLCLPRYEVENLTTVWRVSATKTNQLQFKRSSKPPNSLTPYSFLILFTGLAQAALMVCEVTVSAAISPANNPAQRKTVQLIPI
jgi:hypothetical protein